MAKEKKGFIKEFKEFAISGNMFDMAIGIIIGGVFKDLVTSFTENIIMPIISVPVIRRPSAAVQTGDAP